MFDRVLILAGWMIHVPMTFVFDLVDTIALMIAGTLVYYLCHTSYINLCISSSYGSVCVPRRCALYQHAQRDHPHLSFLDVRAVPLVLLRLEHKAASKIPLCFFFLSHVYYARTRMIFHLAHFTFSNHVLRSSTIYAHYVRLKGQVPRKKYGCNKSFQTQM